MVNKMVVNNVEAIKKTVPHIVAGKSIHEPDDGQQLPIFNPATGETIRFVYNASTHLIDHAVESANLAFKTWSKTTPSHRAKILFKFKNLLDTHLDELASIITTEHGKTHSEAVGSLQRGIDVVDFTCGIPQHLKGSFAENIAVDMDSYSIHQPLGVCLGITPFNFPAMIALWMFPMAIACGNTFILKPSEKDPSSVVKLAELATKAGVPAGVINVLHGDKTVVDQLLIHPGIKAVSFVGSTPVAEHVYKTAANHNKRVQAFGGAKNHCIVMPDADPNLVADAIIASAYGSAGERCMAISVVVAIGDAVADKLIELMSVKIKKLKLGPGTNADTDICPLITKAHWERVKGYIDRGKDEGAHLVLDGSRDNSQKESGFFMGPSLFDHVKPNMAIYREEIFGPVLSMVRVNTVTEALDLINSHEYGNGTSIFTNDGSIARTFAENVEVGMVGINVPIPVPVAHQSFGGWKRSIFADIGMYGTEGIRFYTRLKTVTQRWPSRG